jgi:DNA-binding IclR family transcriptional regulator
MEMALDSTKTKIARRVIEVFDLFATENRRITAMDIVRRYGRPQSSTSELLSALVEMGLLYKEPYSRSYSPTPRLAALGAAVQPEPILSGRLFACMDNLAATTRLGVGLFGVVGTHSQLFRWVDGTEVDDARLRCGSATLLSSCAVGLLLLSSYGEAKAGRLLWRLHADAPENEKFNLVEKTKEVEQVVQTQSITGHSGIIPNTQMTAVLFPSGTSEGPLALGVVYSDTARVDSAALTATLKHAVGQCLDDHVENNASFVPRFAIS